MYLRAFSFLLMLLASGAVLADSLMAQLSSDSARFRYQVAGLGQSFGNLETEVGFLYTDKTAGSNDYIADVGVLVRGESVEAPIVVSIGGRLYAGKVADYNVYAVGLGGDAMLLPESWGGFGIGAFFIMAPGVVSFGDSDGLREYGVTLNFDVSPQASVILGYQNIEVNIETNNVGDVEVDKGAFFGVHIKF
ncbi:MAG: hypothetical protein OEY89_04945 [Gammaproteobacteria bacterium]|nr:hypothetical protein [Gammaproteobacteria bacterium]